VAGRVVAPIPCLVTALTMGKRSVVLFAPVVSCRSLQCATHRTGAAWDAAAGLWNELSHGSISSVDFAFGMKSEPISTQHFSRSLVS
jgi:hypothetical protein